MHEPVTIKSDALKRPQMIHAWAITALPFIGTIAAIIWFRVRALDVTLLVTLYVLTILGITVGFHRHFTHHAFKAKRWVRVALAILGSMACQGPVIYWVANHRRHHTFADQPGDPHSPFFDDDTMLKGLIGFWHAHMGWTFHHDTTNTARFARDLIRDPLVAAVNRRYLAWVALSVLLPPVIGGLATLSWAGVLSAFLWGSLVRLFLTYHATNAVNSITHLFGQRPFPTEGHSTNNAWLAIPVLGEGWHNNHHAFPESAVFGLEWWQLDLGGLVVMVLEKTHLAWEVRRPTREKIAARKAGRAEAADPAGAAGEGPAGAVAPKVPGTNEA
jgi:stearoyl-CoA desaturase (Delta-9 desaturase)